MWPKSEGYRYYDLEGIDPKAARALMHGEPLSDSLRQTLVSHEERAGPFSHGLRHA